MREAQRKYERKLRELGIHRSKSYALKCSIANDADIIAKLDKTTNKCGYIKALIRQDIAANNKD